MLLFFGGVNKYELHIFDKSRMRKKVNGKESEWIAAPAKNGYVCRNT